MTTNTKPAGTFTVQNVTSHEDGARLKSILQEGLGSCYAGFSFGVCPVGGSFDVIATCANTDVSAEEAREFVMGALAFAILNG